MREWDKSGSYWVLGRYCVSILGPASTPHVWIEHYDRALCRAPKNTADRVRLVQALVYGDVYS